MPRTSWKQGKEAISVYKHSASKGESGILLPPTKLFTIILQVPSQLAIYQKMLSDDDSFASTMIPKSKVAKFLDEALKIEDLQ
jgi:hypothetical protein